MRELVKAYGLSFLLHSLLLLGILLLTQKLSPVEKRIIEINLSVEDLRLKEEAISENGESKKQSHTNLPQKIQAMEPSKQEDKASYTASISDIPPTNQEQVMLKPIETPIGKEKTQPAPPPTKDQLKLEQPKQGDESYKVQSLQREELADSSPLPSVSQKQEREGGNPEAQATKDLENPLGLSSQRSGTKAQENPKPAGEEKITSLEEGFLREKLSIISSIVQRRISYPTIARRMGWEGKVLISFVLEPSGEIRELRVLKSSGYDILDREAVDTIKRSHREFPKPPVSVLIKLPVAFKLE